MSDIGMRFGKKRILFFLVVLAASFCCAFLCTRHGTAVPIELSMSVQLPKNGFVKVFYVDSDQEYWSEGKSFASPMFPGNHPSAVKFQIPSKTLKKFRLDFEYCNPGEISISDLVLSGSETFSIGDLKVENATDIKEFKQTSKLFTAKTGEHDPYIVFATPREMTGFMKTDLFLAGIVFVLSIMVFCSAGIAVEKLLAQKKEWSDLLLTVVFCGLICIPVLKIDQRSVLTKENRALAAYPGYFTSKGWINTDFGRQFEAWFNDRFLGRELLLESYQQLLTPVNQFCRRYAVSDAVVEGKDRWFFYRLENSMRNFQNLDLLTEKEMKEALQMLKAQDAWCKKNNIKFYYFIAPDKNKVYGEMVTFVPRVHPDSRSRIALWVDYVRRNSDIKVIYPLEELKAAKEEGLLYYKNDTHWNWFGGCLGYNALMKLIKKDFPDLREFKAEKFTEEKDFYGDLYNFLPHVVGKYKEVYKKPVIEKKFSFPVSDRKSYNFKNPEGKRKALVLRDSFSNAFLAYCFYSFADVTAHWRFALEPQDLAVLTAQKTDILILEHVERNLPLMIKQMREGSAFKSHKE